MEIDLKKLFQSDALERLNVELDLSGVELGGAKPFCAPVRVEARLRGFAGSVELSARVEYTMSMPCDRCAEPVVRDYTKEFSHTLVRESQEDTAEFITVPGERLDLDALVLEDLLMDQASSSAGRTARGYARAVEKTGMRECAPAGRRRRTQG